MPIMLGLFATAEPLVKILLTEKWLPAVPYIRIMCLVYSLYPMERIGLQVIKALGRSDIVLNLFLLQNLFVTIMILITFRLGLLFMVYGQLANTLFAFILYSYYTGKFINYPVSQQIKDILPIISLAVAMSVIIWILGTIGHSNIHLNLIIQIICGIVIFVTGCYLFRVKSFFEVVSIMENHFRSDKSTATAKY